MRLRLFLSPVTQAAAEVIPLAPTKAVIGGFLRVFDVSVSLILLTPVDLACVLIIQIRKFLV